MTLLIGWLALCVVGSLLALRRPAWILSAVIVTRVLIPGVAQGIVMPGLHPSAYLVLVFVLVRLVAAPALLAEALRPSRGGLIAIGLLVVWGFLDVLNPGGRGALNTLASLFSVFVAPALMFALIRHELVRRPRSEAVLLWPFLAVTLLEVPLAFWQVETGEAIVWQSVYQRMWWWGSVGRGLGTTGHGLQLALLFVAAIALSARVRSIAVRFVLAGAYILGIFYTDGRLALLLAIPAVGFLIFYSLRSWFRTFAFSGVIALGAWIGLESEAGQKLLEKFTDDGGSNAKRVAAFDWAFGHLGEFLVVGYPGNRDTRGVGVVNSSLENGFLMAALSYGAVFAVGLLALYVAYILKGFSALDRAFPAALAALLVAVGMNGSSSFMANALEGYVFWYALAFALARPGAAGGTT
ncbi:hypothetical protein SPF06_01565 [Sinomonas sp. JGH33]|uniref:O-antigen ligase domain-containing protein n=1 Tax=Sinomonas terricola TaxID=3110330 RepID=A0ABU5T171_9MICC|nr:hypothetical protein [Sinomonas sp. JGH33]MEA5453399.1 hypothetical protein [Sinomonas sp. JGH33]